MSHVDVVEHKVLDEEVGHPERLRGHQGGGGGHREVSQGRDGAAAAEAADRIGHHLYEMLCTLRSPTEQFRSVLKKCAKNLFLFPSSALYALCGT